MKGLNDLSGRAMVAVVVKTMLASKISRRKIHLKVVLLHFEQHTLVGIYSLVES